MAIKTNHSTETLTPESGSIVIDATGSIKLPVGAAADRPAGVDAGHVRFSSNNSTASPEYYDGSTWQELANKSYVDVIINSTNVDLSDDIANLSLDNLTDVTINSPTNGQVLAYDSLLGQFVSKTHSLTAITRTFTADGVGMTFDLNTTVNSVNNIVVSINGIQQEPFYSYTIVDGHILQFDEVPEVNDRIQARILQTNITTDRPRPRILDISYSIVGQYTTITVIASDVTYGTGAKIGDRVVSRIDYLTENTLQLMVETTTVVNMQSTPLDLTLVDSSGNEFRFANLIQLGTNVPFWTTSNTYIGSFSGGNAIDVRLGVLNASSLTIKPIYSGENTISWLTISGDRIVGTAPHNSSPSRYDFVVQASTNGVVITKKFWLLVI